MVNFEKTQPLKIRPFASLGEEMRAERKAILPHLEVQWLSCGKVLVHVYELQGELTVYLTNEKTNYSKLLATDEGCAKLAYLLIIYFII